MTFFPLNKEGKKKDKWGYCAVASCPSRGQCAPALGTNNFLFSSQRQFNDPNSVVTLTHIYSQVLWASPCDIMLICPRAALITEEPVVLRRVVLTDIQGSGVTVRSWSDSTFLYTLLLSQRGGHLISLFHSSPLQLVGTTGRRAFPADSGVPLKCSKVLSLHKGGGYPSVLIVTEEEEEEGERKKKGGQMTSLSGPSAWILLWLLPDFL